MPDSVAWKPMHGGAQLLARRVVPGMADAMRAAEELFSARPDGTYPWRIEAQKSSRGARVTVTVTVHVAGVPIPPLAARKPRQWEPDMR